MAQAVWGHFSAIHLKVRSFSCANTLSPSQDLNLSGGWALAVVYHGDKKISLEIGYQEVAVVTNLTMWFTGHRN